MARRRYRGRDEQRYVEDQLAEMRERGIADAVEMCPLHPEGAQGAIQEMMKDTGYTRDQSQAWIEHGKETMKRRTQEQQETRERRKEEECRGSYD